MGDSNDLSISQVEGILATKDSPLNNRPWSSKRNLSTRKKCLFLGVIFLICFLMLEGVFFVGQGFKPNGSNPGGTWFNRPVATYDPVAGYRWTPGRSRIARFQQGEKIFDQVFQANNRGYISSRDYFPDKPAGVKRLIVFGDSFTAGEFLATPWPDRLHELLGKDSGRVPFEICSFAVDGGGLHNWHSLFFKEVIPNYAFDGVIVASFREDLARLFTIYHCQNDRLLFGRFPQPPASLRNFETDYLPKMEDIARIADDADIDRRVEQCEGWHWHWPGLQFHGVRAGRAGVKALLGWEKTGELADRELLTASKTPLTRADLDKEYGREVIGRLFDMLDYCQKEKIPVLLCSIPTREGAMAFSQNKGQGWNTCQRELASLAGLYDQNYFDGYEVFADLSAAAIRDQYWLKYDGHWGQQGADRFAEKLAQFVRACWEGKFKSMTFK